MSMAHLHIIWKIELFVITRDSTILSGEWSGTKIAQQYNIVRAEY